VVELKEVQSKRGRNQDRDSLNRSKRRRSYHSYGDKAKQISTEERFENEYENPLETLVYHGSVY
jgi:hypothetical protein